MMALTSGILAFLLSFFAGTQSLDYSGEIDSSVIPENASVIVSAGGYKTILKQMGPSAQIPPQVLDMIDGDHPGIAYISIDEWNAERMPLEDFVEKNIIAIIPIDVTEDAVLAMIQQMGGRVQTLENDIYSAESDMFFTFITGDSSEYIVFATSIPSIESYLDSAKIPDGTTDQAARIAEFIDNYGSKLATLYIDNSLMNKLEVYGTSMGSQFMALPTDDLETFLSQYNLDIESEYSVGYITDLSLPFEITFLTELANQFQSSIFDIERVQSAVYLPDDPFIYAEIKISPSFVADLLETMNMYGEMQISPNQVNLFESALSGSLVGAVYPRSATIQTMFSTTPAFIAMLGIDDADTMQTIIDLLIPYKIATVQDTSVYQFNGGVDFPNINIFLGNDELIIASDQKYMSQYLENVSNEDDSFGSFITNVSGDNRILNILFPDSELLNQGLVEIMRNSPMRIQPFTIESINLRAEIAEDEESFGYYFEIN